jgi:DDE superfamily endonuclease
VSVAFAATASGTKLKALILIPRMRPLEFNVPDNVVVVYGTNGNFNERVIAETFASRVLDPFMLVNNYTSSHLLLDHAPCHLTPMVKQSMKERNITLTYVPKRLTNLLQPADVSWMRPLKREYSEKWNDWMINAPKTRTTAGNLKSPGYIQAITWISEIWKAFDSKLLESSFDSSGICTSEIHLYHNQLKNFAINRELIDDIQVGPAYDEEEEVPTNIEQFEEVGELDLDPYEFVDEQI